MSMKSTFQRIMSILAKGRLIYTYMVTKKRMRCWINRLIPEYLYDRCATCQSFGNTKIDCNQCRVTDYPIPKYLVSLPGPPKGIHLRI